jgi:MFS transporter, FHS family, glucose/mannose:H+ symporter
MLSEILMCWPLEEVLFSPRCTLSSRVFRPKILLLCGRLCKNMVPNTTALRKVSVHLDNQLWTRLAWSSLGLYAWASVLTGANLPDIVKTFDLSPSLAGLLVAVPALGFTAAGLVGGYLSKWLGLQRLLALSASGMTFSLLLGTISPSRLSLFLAVLCIGFFGGLLETGCNGLIAELHVGKAARELNRLHIFFGIGAFVSPLIVTTLLAFKIVWQVNYAIAGILAIILTGILARQPNRSHMTTDASHLGEFVKVVKTPATIRVWVGALLYVASELGFSNWIVTYLRQRPGFSPELASISLSIFWLAVLVGRYMNTRLPVIHKDRYVIMVEAFGSSLFLLLTLFFKDVALSVLAIVMIGFFMAGLLPWLLAYANERNSGYAGAISGFVQSGAGVGMLIGPGFIGILAQYTNLSFAMGISVILIFILGLIFILPEKSG